jgi:RNA polymerase sigma-70 factor (ECF subfamily)
VLTNIESYNPSVPFTAWIRRIAINTAIDDFRKNSKHNLIEYSDEISTNENYTINDYDLEIRAEELNNMILKLPKATKLVFNLFAIDGYSHKEIAEQLEISTNTSKWHVKEARKKLKEQILKKQNLVEK